MRVEIHNTIRGRNLEIFPREALLTLIPGGREPQCLSKYSMTSSWLWRWSTQDWSSSSPSSWRRISFSSRQGRQSFLESPSLISDDEKVEGQGLDWGFRGQREKEDLRKSESLGFQMRNSQNLPPKLYTRKWYHHNDNPRFESRRCGIPSNRIELLHTSQ